MAQSFDGVVFVYRVKFTHEKRNLYSGLVAAFPVAAPRVGLVTLRHYSPAAACSYPLAISRNGDCLAKVFNLPQHKRAVVSEFHVFHQCSGSSVSKMSRMV